MRNRARRAIGASSLCFLVIGFGVLIVPTSWVGAAVVVPTYVEGNTTCGALDPTWVEFYKVEPVTDLGVWPGPDAEMRINWATYTVDGGQAFDWSSTFPIMGVFVKGGPAGNLYRYSGGSMGDSLLHAPANPGGGWAGLSHISFCYNPAPVTTTTVAESTSSTEPSNSTTPDSTTTTTAETSTSQTTVSTSLGAIGDYVWQDSDADGLQDEFEPGVEGISVGLYSVGDDSLVGSDTTDADGLYWFDDLDAGDYYLVFEGLEEGDSFTAANAGGDDEIDSDVDRDGRTTVIQLGSGEVDDTWDAGILRVRVLPQVITTSTISETLPFTGKAGAPSLAGLALTLLGFGGMIVLSRRRREDQPIVGWSARLPEVL